MSTNFVSGLVSGIDTAALVDATIKAQSGPLLLLQRRQAESTARLSAWKSLEAILVSLKVESDRLGRAALWNGLQTTSGDEEVLTATASGDSAIGSHQVSVVALAAAHQIHSQNYSSSAADVGSGTLSITFGGETTDLVVAAGTTLAELADRINEAELGITAALVTGRDASGGSVTHLVVTGGKTGADQTITVGGTLTGGEAPVFTTTRAASDAHILFGGPGGLDLYSATNTFEDLVQGLDVTVHAVSDEGDSVLVDVARDSEGLKDAVRNFIDRYNTVVSFVNGQFKYDAATGARPPLLGDSTLTGVAANLRSSITRIVGGTESSAYRSLFSVGIKSGSNGELTFDETAFGAALDADYGAVADLFRPRARVGAEGVEWVSAPETLDLGGRAIEVVVTQAAAKARLAGELVDVGAGITIDASNDAFKFVVNGTTSEVLHLEHGTYTDGAALAAALQDAIDGSEELDRLGATVTFDVSSGSTGRFVITSEREGAESSIQLLVTSGTMDDALGLSSLVNVRATGTDAAGTIGGIAAKGDGSTLSIDDEDSELFGLTFRIGAGEGDVPLTTTAAFSEGVGRGLSRRLFSLTDLASGMLGRVTKTVEGQIERFGEAIAAKQRILDDRRARLMARYARLESTLGQLQSQGNFIAAQVSSIRAASNAFNSNR